MWLLLHRRVERRGRGHGYGYHHSVLGPIKTTRIESRRKAVSAFSVRRAFGAGGHCILQRPSKKKRNGFRINMRKAAPCVFLEPIKDCLPPPSGPLSQISFSSGWRDLFLFRPTLPMTKSSIV
jgi:hypothetical protein